MSKRYVLTSFVLLLLAFLWAACANSDPSHQGYRIAVIPKGTTHEFWRSIHAGAVKAEREFTENGIAVEVIWKGPLREDDREQQIEVVESFISQRVDGIVLAPLDDRALVRPVEEALRAGIPTVIIDSALHSDSIVSFVATDNTRGGELAAEQMGKLLEGKGKVMMLRHQEGSASTRNREQGFLTKLKAEFPGIDLVSSDQYAGATRDTAKRASENLLNRYSDVLQGIFCPNESASVGMLLALQDIGKAGKIVFVGFDVTDMLMEAMRKGQLHGVVVQHPFRMGYLGVKTMVDDLLGQPVGKRVDTGVILVSPDQLDDPEMHAFLQPPIDQYLD